MTLLTCPSCHTGGHLQLYGDGEATAARCARCIADAAAAVRQVRLSPARVTQLESLSSMQVKRCSRCGYQTFARRAYHSLCRGEHGPTRHPIQIMQPVIIGPRI